MTEPGVDLTSLRELTGGDLELEKELFEEFIWSATKLIASLHGCYSDDAKEDWYQYAHAIMGLAANLGAMPLAEKGRIAQQLSEEGSAEQKQAIIPEIEAEFALAKAFLENEMRS